MSVGTVNTIAAGDGIEVAIRREHEAATSATRIALDHAMECGRLLAQARQGIGHGNWETFVRDTCGIAPRTGRLYLRLHANRDRLADRQRVAGLTVRDAARLLAEPKMRHERKIAEATALPKAHLGPHWLKLTSVSAEFAEGWTLPAIAINDSDALEVPTWYSPACWHRGEHDSGWAFEVSPDRADAERVNVIAHNPAGNVHLACFDGMSPQGILPFMAACETHHAMPRQSSDWSVSSVPVSIAPDSLTPPYPFTVFRLAYSRHHTCYCWPLVDEAIGVAAREGDPGCRAWLSFGRALAAIVKANPGH
jgi:hypothetical protein